MEKKSSINDFKILKKLGEGSYGKVYQVQRRDSKEVFAMKEIKV